MKTQVLITSALLLTSCSIPIAQNSTSIKDANEKMVEECEFVSNFDGGSVLGLAPGISRAKNVAREYAQQQGVTHMVWISTDGSYASTATGAGYKCKS